MSREGPETKLVNKMRVEAKKRYGSRWTGFKHHGGPYSKAGVSDIIGCLDGCFVAVEVKAPESYGGSVEKALAVGPTTKQREFAANVIASGGVAGFAASVDGFMSLLAIAARDTSGDDL